MAASAPSRVLRFGRTERALHWVHATAFTIMLATGLVLYLPLLAQQVGDRPLMKGIHLATAAAWLTALALVAVLGDRPALGRARREIERFDADDLLWLRRRAAPQGRFNAGQKVHSVLQALLAVTFTVSGVLLWLGERDTALRLPGTIALHDVSMYLLVVLVAGHLFKALAPDTRPALEGVTGGTVPAAWAAEHHPKWQARPPGLGSIGWRRPRVQAIVLAGVIAAAGLAVGVALVSA